MIPSDLFIFLIFPDFLSKRLSVRIPAATQLCASLCRCKLLNVSGRAASAKAICDRNAYLQLEIALSWPPMMQNLIVRV